MHLWLLQGKWACGSELSNTGPRESLLLLLLLLFSCHLKVLHSKCLNVMSYLFGSLTLFLKLYEISIPIKLSGLLLWCFTVTHTQEVNQFVCSTSVRRPEHSFPSPPGQLLWLSSTATPSQMPFTLLSPPSHSSLSYTSWKFSYSSSSAEQIETASNELHSHDAWVHLKATAKEQKLKSHTVLSRWPPLSSFPLLFYIQCLDSPYCHMLTKVHASQNALPINVIQIL